MKKRILIAGASGLIGRQIPNLAIGHHTHILVRTKVQELADGIVQHVADPGRWSEIIATLQPDVAISCLGTTFKKSGRDESRFRAVDHDLVLAFASSARAAGASHFITVSSVGATANTRNLYLRTKGEVERALSQMGYDRLDILRPGLLTGERVGDSRFAEKAAILLSPVIDHLVPDRFSRYRSIAALTVAHAIVNLAEKGGNGKFIHENDAIRALAG